MVYTNANFNILYNWKSDYLQNFSAMLSLDKNQTNRAKQQQQQKQGAEVTVLTFW